MKTETIKFLNKAMAAVVFSAMAFIATPHKNAQASYGNKLTTSTIGKNAKSYDEIEYEIISKAARNAIEQAFANPDPQLQDLIKKAAKLGITIEELKEMAFAKVMEEIKLQKEQEQSKQKQENEKVK